MRTLVPLRRSRPHVGKGILVGIATTALIGAPVCAHADEGGVSFWAPGQFGSLSAVPTTPGWALPLVYYHVDADAGGQKNFIVGGNLTAGIDAKADLLFFFPTYTWMQPVLGGQASFGLGWAVGHLRGTADVLITGPQGNQIEERRTDTVSGGSDLYGLGTLKWNDGNNNYIAYTMFGAPTGAYRLGRLANISTNHWSIDGGGGYTYFDQKRGHEFSIVGGLTYNFENDDTHYKNGIDSHIDWSRASNSAGLQKNADGSVDVFFAPKAPEGKDSNWVPTQEGKGFEILFRFYGPEKPLFDKTWQLPDIEEIK